MAGDAPASLYDMTVRNARDEFAPRAPNPWIGDALDELLAVTSRIAVVELPELTRRFEADWEPFVQRIESIGQDARLRGGASCIPGRDTLDSCQERDSGSGGPNPPTRAMGDAMLAATLGLHFVKGEAA